MSHDDDGYHWSIGPVSYLRVGVVWAFDIGRMRWYGVTGIDWGFTWINGG